MKHIIVIICSLFLGISTIASAKDSNTTEKKQSQLGGQTITVDKHAEKNDVSRVYEFKLSDLFNKHKRERMGAIPSHETPQNKLTNARMGEPTNNR